MKGDIAFAGFLLTADEWQALDGEARSQLIAVATRRADPWFDHLALAPAVTESFAEGSGPLEIEEVHDAEVELLEEAAAMGDPFAGLEDVPLTRALDRAM